MAEEREFWKTPIGRILSYYTHEEANAGALIGS